MSTRPRGTDTADCAESVEADFRTVDAVLATGAATCQVDAFALALIKVERQARKLFTHLVYQFPVFTHRTRFDVVQGLLSRRDVYLEGVIRGLDQLSPRSVAELIGPDHNALRARIDEATRHRRKIFHGQLTPQRLTKEALAALTADLRKWCALLANGAQQEFGYDGLRRNSLRKSADLELWRRLGENFQTREAYWDFVKSHMTRKG